MMKGPGTVLVILFAVAYPFVVFFGIGTLGPRILAVVLAAFAIVRFVSNADKSVAQTVMVALILALCGLIFVLESQRLLKLYPVLFSIGMAAAFYFSLYDEHTLIERLATRFGSKLHDAARRYIRRLTVWWVGVLLVNAAISAYTAFYGTLYQWTLYNGLISYLLMGTFMAGEFCFRLYYKKSRGLPS